MTIRNRIEEAKGYSTAHCQGEVTAEDFLGHLRRLIRDPAWPTARQVHLSAVDAATLGTSLTRAVLEEAAELFGSAPEKIRGLRFGIVPGDRFQDAVAFERSLIDRGARVVVLNGLHHACHRPGLSVEDEAETLRVLGGAAPGPSRAEDRGDARAPRMRPSRGASVPGQEVGICRPPLVGR